jgi:phosphomannomutase / phosphoglucomutase
MSETDPHKARQMAAQLRPLLPFVAAALAVFAVWLAWNGWKQTQDDARRTSVTTARDGTVQLTATTLGGEVKRLQDRLASAELQAALEAGDFAAASRVLAADWPQLEHAEVLSADLVAAYDDLSDTGFGRLAAMEAALAEGKPVVWIVRHEGRPAVALTAPAVAGDSTLGVAFARLPLSRATLALESVPMDANTYIALRQGNFTLLERDERWSLYFFYRNGDVTFRVEAKRTVGGQPVSLVVLLSKRRVDRCN